MSPIGRQQLTVRWLKFNAVGVLGIGVQFAAFNLLLRLPHLSYLAATALAVETAVLHNFVWHQRFTWKERSVELKERSAELKQRSAKLPRDLALRLLRFHAANGLVSIVGNVVMMHGLAGGMHLNLYLATGISIAVCSIFNFALSEWFVFRQ